MLFSIYLAYFALLFLALTLNILGGCERILKTPQPIIYTLILRKLVIFYCLLLPLAVIKDFQGFTIVIITFVSIILFGIEQIGSQLEQPFAHNPNALPLDLICQTILLNVQELIKQTNQDNQAFSFGENGHDPLTWQSESQTSHTDKKQITLKDLIAFSDSEHLN